MDIREVKVSFTAHLEACSAHEKQLRSIMGGQIMRKLIRVGLLLFGIAAFTTSSVTFSQDRDTPARPGGWQGPWLGDQRGSKPAPQSEEVSPGRQRPSPAGPQVMEVPPRPQSLPEPPRQQASIPPHPQPGEQHATQFITVTVTDPQGRYVTRLQPEDFEVYENEERQRITYFNTGEKEPFSMGILVDTSDSMRSKIDRARFALRRLIDSFRYQDEIFIEEFNDRPRLLQDFTDSRLLLTRAVGSLRPSGGTALYDAVLDGLSRVLQGLHSKKTLLIISDGADTRSYSSLEQAISLARRAGVLIYAIGISDFSGGDGFQIGPFGLGGVFSSRAEDERGNRVLLTATEQTGGRLFIMKEHDILENESVLDHAVQTISGELRSQYTIGYIPKTNGTHYRDLRVVARGADGNQLTVRTPKVYATDSPQKTARQQERRIQRW
jgi:Ca-activated chloride channel family protein